MELISNEISVEKQIQDILVIMEISHLMGIEKSMDSLLQVIMSGTTKVLNAERSTLFLCDDDTKELYSRIAQNSEINEIRFPMNIGIAGSVATTRQTINIKEAYEDSRFNPEIDKKTGYRTKTILCMPLINRDDKVIGVTQVLNKIDGIFTDYDEKLLKIFSHHVAIAVENTMLYEENDLLFKSMIRTLSTTIDARDPVTAGHSHRVAMYSQKLAREIGLSEKEINEIDVAAWLHDVGKIGVRDDVLLKPGRLSPEEYKKIQEHALYTKEILDQVYFSRDLRQVPFIASAHHERIDGKGYPYGLHMEELPISARILAITDVYDALTAYDRPYKKAMPVEKAISILLEGRGTQFDSELLDIFIEKKCYNIERRQHQRISSDINIELTFLSVDDQKKYSEQYPLEEPIEEQPVENEELSDISSSTKVIDISIGGMQFKTRYYFPIGNFIEFNIQIKDKKFNVISRVVRIERSAIGLGYFMAVSFMNLTAENKKLLAKYIASLSTQEKSTDLIFY